MIRASPVGWWRPGLAEEGSWAAGGGGADKTRQPLWDIAASEHWTLDPVPCATHYHDYIVNIWQQNLSVILENGKSIYFFKPSLL